MKIIKGFILKTFWSDERFPTAFYQLMKNSSVGFTLPHLSVVNWNKKPLEHYISLTNFIIAFISHDDTRRC